MMSDLTQEELGRIRDRLFRQYPGEAPSVLVADIESLVAALDARTKDIEAYRGALGYPIVGTHNGLLSDGTLASNGIAKALSARLAEVEEERKVGEDLLGTFFEALKPLNLKAIYVENPGWHVTELIRDRDAWKHAAEQAAGMHLVENIGETLHNLKQENRRLREALELIQRSWEEKYAADPTTCAGPIMYRIAKQALSPTEPKEACRFTYLDFQHSRICSTHSPMMSSEPHFAAVCDLGLAELRAKVEAASDAYKAGYRKAQEDAGAISPGLDELACRFENGKCQAHVNERPYPICGLAHIRLCQELDEWKNTAAGLVAKVVAASDAYKAGYRKSQEEANATLDEQRVHIEAWYKVFGTSQLTHAAAAVEEAKRLIGLVVSLGTAFLNCQGGCAPGVRGLTMCAVHTARFNEVDRQCRQALFKKDRNADLST